MQRNKYMMSDILGKGDNMVEKSKTKSKQYDSISI